MSKPFSFNKFIVKAHQQDRTLRTKVDSGFAFVENKVSMVPLLVIVDAHLDTGLMHQIVPVGSIVHVKEEELMCSWAQKKFVNDVLGEFMIVEFNKVEIIQVSEMAE